MKVLLGVGAGIAAYKACEIVRALKKRGDEVRVIMTRGAQEFVRPLTLQVLSENLVGTEIFDATFESQIGHIDLARWADVVLLAPATADLIARLAGGLADDLLTTVILATRAPLVVAPSMNTQMWFHPLVQKNLKILSEDAGYLVVSPDSGELACKEVGPGRLPDPPVLLDWLDRAATPQILKGSAVLVSAGPTREYIDPARFISNPSSGKMGYALARAAWAAGAQVTLVSGPTALEEPAGVHMVGVSSALQMHAAVMSAASKMDFICMTAAVADFRPAQNSGTKREKTTLDLNLQLSANPDILAELGTRGLKAPEASPFLIGFAAETHDVVERARAKRLRKGADMIVANQIGGAGSAFGAESSRIAMLMGPAGQPETRVVEHGPATKRELAGLIWREAVEFRGARSKPSPELHDTP